MNKQQKGVNEQPNLLNMSGDIGDVNNDAQRLREQHLSTGAGHVTDLIRCEKCQLVSDDKLSLLTCMHVVCKQCTSNCYFSPTGSIESSDSICCPQCGKRSHVLDDSLFSHLLEKQGETARTLNQFDLCANCEHRFMVEDLQFCKVCREKLCNECRISTHSAKMFSSHVFETNFLPKMEVITCCNHPGRNAVIANLIQNNFVCVDCFSDFDEDSKSSCVEFSSAIETRKSQVSDSLRILKAQQNQVTDRLSEIEAMFVDLKKSNEEKTKEVSNFADKLVREIRLVENQLLKQLEKDLAVNEDAVSELRNKVAFFGSSLGLYSNMFEVMTSSYPDQNFLTWTSDIQERLAKVNLLKSQCMVMKLVGIPEFGADFKGVFKKALFEKFRNDAVSSMNLTNVDPFQLQNLALFRSLSSAPVNLQKLLACRGVPPTLDLSSLANLKIKSPKTESTNSSRSSSSLNYKLCREVEEVRKKMKNLSNVFADNAKKVQSLQLDVTRRKVYPKRQEAESLSLEVEKFLSMSEDLIKEAKTALSNLEIGYSESNCETIPDFDKDYNMEQCKTFISNIEGLRQKHERIRQILKSIKPYISSVTIQKEKSSFSFVPSNHSDYIDDLKRNVVVTEQVTEQRIHAIEAMYKSQYAERSNSVNNSEIHKELQLTKQKLKKARVLSYEDVSDAAQTSFEPNCE